MKRIAIGLGVLTMLVLAAPAGAELCEKCKGGMYIMSVGKCVECGGPTGSGAFKLCKKCSAKLGQCEHCRAPLKGAKPAPEKSTPARLRALELDASSSGKTVSAIVGQQIIIRLKSNPTTGYSWVVGKIEGDALRQVGKVKYEQRKHAPGMVGVGGKEVFTFRTTRAGTAKLMLEYKGPGKKIARTFTLTLNVKPAPAKSAPSGLALLELDESANGKTVSVFVGQEIVIRLKGNATTGYSWVVGKIKGDALGQIGKVKYVSDQPPMPAGGRGRRLMRHRVGGGGKYVFTFTAQKAGKAKLTLEYKRGWEKNKPPAKTFTLTVDIKADPTAERVKKLRANINSFKFALDYHGPQQGKSKGKRRPRGLVLSVPTALVKAAPGNDYVIISKKQAEKIIAHLADEGFLSRALDITNVLIDPPGGPIYWMQVNAGKMRLHEYLGWDLKMLKRLDGLRKVLDGDAAKAMDKLLKRLEGQRKEWTKKKPA